MENNAENVITWSELMKHNKSKDLDLWVLIDGGVYDVGTYLSEHPGGDDVLKLHGG